MKRPDSAAKYVDVWRDYAGDTDDYSVSLADDDGEIRCVGSGDHAEAWQIACEYADDLGIPARDLCAGTDEVVDTYVPDTAEGA